MPHEGAVADLHARRIQAASRQIRGARNLTLAMLVSWPIVAMTVMSLADFMPPPYQSLGFFVVVLYGVLAVLSSLRWQFAVCPVCDHPFFRRGIRFAFRFRCMQCGYNLRDVNSVRKATW